MTESSGQSRSEVVVTKETIEDWTLYVTAGSSEEAHDAADEIVQHCAFPEYEVIHSEYYLDAKPINPRHDAQPTRVDETQGMVCAVCLTTVEWTGIAADDPDNRSGKTIPGPWVHARTNAG
jgi:hypothetical protein